MNTKKDQKKKISFFAAASLFRVRFYRFSPIHLRECSLGAHCDFLSPSLSTSQLLLTFYFFSFTSIHEAFVYYKYYSERCYGPLSVLHSFSERLLNYARKVRPVSYSIIYRQAESVSTKTYILVSREYLCATNNEYYYYYTTQQWRTS